MRRGAPALGVALLALAACDAGGGGKQAAATCDTPATRFCDSKVPLPPGWTGARFALSQDYPAEAPVDAQPWRSTDFHTDPGGYAEAVIGYFFEGQIRDDMARSFDPRLNTLRQWYHAPWLDVGANGREPLHGLTRERASMPGELGPAQKEVWNNWAVGFYNAPGGEMFGRVWKDHGKPDPAQTNAPEGTVAAKLLFTTAPESEVPWLKGSPEWDAYIFTGDNLHVPGNIAPDAPRAVHKVRLLQIDFAVKDSRSTDTGWVFGTFVYGGGPTGGSGAGWEHIAPVGVMWGNDPGYPGSGPLKQTWLNPAVKLPHYGYQGRLDGPVDNPKSSCLSCHMTAQSPETVATLVAKLLPPKGADPAPWFVNLKSGTPFTPGKQSSDYSMQIAFGLANFGQTQIARSHPDPEMRKVAAAQLEASHASPLRGAEPQ